MQRHVTWLAITAVLALVGTLGVREYQQGGVLTSDTLQLLDGVAATDACLGAGELRCRRGVERWPVLQYIPALALKRAGRSRLDTANDLVYLNGLAVLATLAMLWFAGRRLGSGFGPILLLAGIVSPLLWYGSSGFGEALAACATTGLVVSLLMSWNALAVAAFMFVATLSKETALPFLVLLGAIALVVRAGFRRPTARDVIPLAAGAVAGVAAISLFNLFRFGVPWNSYYLGGDWRTHGLAWKANFAVAGVIAPNAGIVWFWPVAAALLFVSAALAVRTLRRRSRDVAAVTVAVTLFVLAALIVSFADWWGPFGWQAYADRLLVPWVPAVVVLTVWAGRHMVVPALARLADSLVLTVVTGIVVTALGVAQLGSVLEPLRPMRLFSTPPVCPPTPHLFQRISSGDEQAHSQLAHCVSLLAWRHPPVLADDLKALTPSRLPLAVLYVLAVAGLVAEAAIAARTCAQRRDVASRSPSTWR